MKTKLLLVLALISVILSGCQSQDDKHEELYRNYMRNNVTFEYNMADEISTFYKPDLKKIIYYYEKVVNEEGKAGRYEIVQMSYVDKDISSEMIYTVRYPEKTSVVNETDDSIVIEKLESGFQEKLKEYDLTWGELDDFMIWYQLLSTGQKTFMF